ncbi:MAG: hypothetical protein ACOC33_03795 [bacterium]
MIACCNFYQYQYLNEDYSLNKEKYMEMIVNLGINGIYAPYPNELCKCECHIINSNIIH